jgi:hypothetical protein
MLDSVTQGIHSLAKHQLYGHHDEDLGSQPCCARSLQYQDVSESVQGTSVRRCPDRQNRFASDVYDELGWCQDPAQPSTAFAMMCETSAVVDPQSEKAWDA